MSSKQPSAWTRWDILLLLVFVTGVARFSRFPFKPPEPVGVEAADSVFSAERAMDHLRVIARGPHLPGSPEHEVVREYLFDQLSGFGFETEYQNTTWLRGTGNTRAVAVWNVVGRIPGTDPSGAVLLMAHYDPVPHSSGANDDGTGVAAILETLRALGTGPALKNDLIVLFSDGEELGLMGAAAFVDGHRWFPAVSVVLNFEVKGNAGASWMFETAPENGWVIRAFAEADPRRVANSMSLDVYRRMPNDTDYSPFRDAGVQGMNFSSMDGANTYHLALDNLDNTSPPTLQHHGLHALALTRHLGGADLSQTQAPDVVFSTVPLLGFIYYPAFGDWIGLLLAFLLAGVAFAVGRRRGGMRTKGVLTGLGVALGSMIISGLISAEVYDWLRRFHPEYGLLHGSSFHREKWYFLSMVILSWTVLVSLVATCRRWFRLSELAWGGALAPLLGALAMVVWMPLAALNLVWPVLFGEAALLWFVLRLEDPPGEQLSRTLRLLVLGVILCPVITFLMPMTEVLWVAMSIAIVPACTVLATAGLILVLPILAPFQARNRWRTPLVLAFHVVLFLGMGIAVSSATADRPTPARLFFVMDAEEGRAWWATADDSDISWIRERVPDTVVRDGEGEGDFYPTGFLTAAADPVEVEAPQLLVLKDTIQGDQRVIRLSITSRIRAERLDIRPREGLESVLLAVNDRALDRDGAMPGRSGWPLSHWGDPGGGVEVEFSVPADAEAPELLLRETSYRPGELLGTGAFQRPPHLIPSIVGTSDVAIFGLRIRL